MAIGNTVTVGWRKLDGTNSTIYFRPQGGVKRFVVTSDPAGGNPGAPVIFCFDTLYGRCSLGVLLYGGIGDGLYEHGNGDGQATIPG